MNVVSQMIVTKFTNEVGNPIRVRIKKQTIEGTNSRTGKVSKHAGVSITIVGPTSEAENIITFEEAKNLHRTLDTFLSQM
jgi:hypothetical protein